MIKAFLSDFSRVLLSPKDDTYSEGLNALHKKLSAGGAYDFWAYFKLNQDLLGYYKNLGERIPVYMFTTEHIQEHPSLQPELAGVFRQTFSGARLGLDKTEPQSYSFIAKEIGFQPEEILYIDDKQANLDAAHKAGMAVIHFENNNQAMEDIQKLFALN